MNPERDKYLTEAIGECWHEWGYDYTYHQCQKCRKYLPVGRQGFGNVELIHTDFSSSEGFFKLKEFMEKQKYWDDFLNWYLVRHDIGMDVVTKLSRLFSKDRFADAVYEFLKKGGD